MVRTFVVVAMLGTLAASAAAQWTTPPYVAGHYTRLLQERTDSAWRNIARVTARGDSALPLRFIVPADSQSARVCRMPVAVPDTTRLAPMPRIALEPEASAPMPRVDVSCHNPLFFRRP
jgi:hypothetical protein